MASWDVKGTVLAVLVLLACIGGVVKCASDCDARGGVLVRGAFGLECVQAAP